MLIHISDYFPTFVHFYLDAQKPKSIFKGIRSEENKECVPRFQNKVILCVLMVGLMKFIKNSMKCGLQYMMSAFVS